MRIDRRGRVHDDYGHFSAILWGAFDCAGRRITLTQAALRHARGEDEENREVRGYPAEAVIRIAVERGDRYADEMQARERLIARSVGPSFYLVAVVEIYGDAGTVVTAYAMRRVPRTWRRL